MPEASSPARLPLRLAHLTTVDMSLALLLGTELAVDVEQGHTVFGISASGPYVGRVEALGVIHVPVASLTRSWSLVSDLKAFFELLRTLRRLDLDVLHTHTPKAGVLGRIAGRLAGVPVVVNTCHGLWARPEDPRLRRAFVYTLEGIAVRFSDFELFQNAADRDTLLPILKPGRHRVVGNGVDLDRFRPDPEGRRRVRAELGIGDDVLLVGTIGRRVHEKGLAEFAEAAHLLKDEATFIWVGPDDATDSAAPVPHESAVRFVGERTDMPSVYSALDVFVLASHREGFSRASMEAAACGVPMVLTDIRGCREIGEDGTHMLLTPPYQGAQLASTVRRLMQDPPLRARMSHAARTRALTTFNQRDIARASLDAYDVVAGSTGRPDRPTTGVQRSTVLHVLPTDMARGAQAYAGLLRDALGDDPKQRHRVVTLFAGPDAAARADLKLGVRSGLLRRAGFDPRAALRLRDAIGRHRPSVVIAHGGEALKYVIPAAGRTPTVYYKVGLSSAELSRVSRVGLYRMLASRATAVVAISEAVATQLRDTLHVAPDRLTVIPNGRDPQVFQPPETPPTPPPLVMFVGHLETGKRPELFLDMVAELRRRRIEFEAALVGDGHLRVAVERRCVELGVQFLGRRTDVPDLLRTASVLVMTSAAETEGMPGVLIEAGLSGVPVVSTAAAGVADVVAHGETGFVADSDQAIDLADAVGRLLGDEALRARVSVAARQRCLERFSVPATASLWRELAAELGGADS